jgi:hypothetical protein
MTHPTEREQLEDQFMGTPNQRRQCLLALLDKTDDDEKESQDRSSSSPHHVVPPPIDHLLLTTPPTAPPPGGSSKENATAEDDGGGKPPAVDEQCDNDDDSTSSEDDGPFLRLLPRAPSSPSAAEIQAVARNHTNEQRKPSPKRKSPPGTTTAPQLKKTKAQTKIKVRGRVYTTRKAIIHLLTKDKQKAVLKEFKDRHRLYGTVLRGTENKGYVVSFDIFPTECKTCAVIRKRLTTVADGEEEKEQQQDPKRIVISSSRQQKEEKRRPTPVCQFWPIYAKESIQGLHVWICIDALRTSVLV